MLNFLHQLNLQYFGADNGGNGGGTETGENPGVEQPGVEQPVETPETTDQENSNQGESGKPEGSEKMLTQKEVNDLIARETRKAQEKLLKQLGVKDLKSAKDGLEKFRKMQEEQMSEQERIALRAKELEQEKEQLSTQVSTLNAQLAALKADVNPDSLDDVIVLANALVDENTDVEAAINKVLEKYPHFKKQQPEPETTEEDKKPKFSTGKHKTETKSELDKWLEAFKI